MKVLISTLLTAASLTSTFASAAEPLEATGILITANLSTATAKFVIELNKAPDFTTTDGFGRPMDQLQFWTDSEAPNPIGRTYACLNGVSPDCTSTVISWDQIAETGKLEVIWPKPPGSPGPWSNTGWGEPVAMIDFSVSADNTLTFTVPLALLREDDDQFYYSLETYNYGGTIRSYHGFVSGVPEPSTYLLLLGGLGILGFAARYRKA